MRFYGAIDAQTLPVAGRFPLATPALRASPRILPTIAMPRFSPFEARWAWEANYDSWQSKA